MGCSQIEVDVKAPCLKPIINNHCPGASAPGWRAAHGRTVQLAGTGLDRRIHPEMNERRERTRPGVKNPAGGPAKGGTRQRWGHGTFRGHGSIFNAIKSSNFKMGIYKILRWPNRVAVPSYLRGVFQCILL